MNNVYQDSAFKQHLTLETLIIKIRGKYTLSTFGLAHLQIAYLWFENWHFTHLWYFPFASVTLFSQNVKKLRGKKKSQKQKTYQKLKAKEVSSSNS